MPAPWTIPAAVSGRKPFGEVPCVLVDNEQIEWIPRDLSLSLLRIPYAGDLIVASSFRRLGIPTLCEVGTLHHHEWKSVIDGQCAVDLGKLSAISYD